MATDPIVEARRRFRDALPTLIERMREIAADPQVDERLRRKARELANRAYEAHLRNLIADARRARASTHWDDDEGTA
jgi:hypothetical protein